MPHSIMDVHPIPLVPDNVKSAGTMISSYEPKVNDTFADFAEYYETVVLPEGYQDADGRLYFDKGQRLSVIKIATRPVQNM